MHLLITFTAQGSEGQNAVRSLDLKYKYVLDHGHPHQQPQVDGGRRMSLENYQHGFDCECRNLRFARGFPKYSQFLASEL